MLHFSQWKIVAIAFIAVMGLILAAPNFIAQDVTDDLPDWVPDSRMTLGLDLQGGSHLLFEVDAPALQAETANDLREQIRADLREARIGYSGLATVPNGATVTLRDPAQAEAAEDILDEIATGDQAFALGAATPDTIVSQNGNTFTLALTDDGLTRRLGAAVDQSIEVVRRRIDELGTTEPSIQRQGIDRILVQVPGLDDPEQLKALIGSTAKMTFQLVDTSTTAAQAGDRPPPGTEILPSIDVTDGAESYVVEQRIMVSGEDLVDAQPGFDGQTGEPVVNFRFNASGGRRFCNVTTRSVGVPFAIVLDGEVISAPVIRSAICGGSGQISGNFTVEEANELSILLRAGALPAPLNILEERTVGPGLGADSVAAGSTAAIIGAIAVLIFMIATYGLFGVFANIALIVNIGMIIAILSVLGATLTLPGIAGIVLTIGMAVDSNVIIFERIREEARNGRQAISAIDIGFSRALGTILDANITTLIAAVTLFFLGSGPVRGFSVTLAIGIITTVFTAYTVTRLLVALWVRRTRPRAVPI